MAKNSENFKTKLDALIESLRLIGDGLDGETITSTIQGRLGELAKMANETKLFELEQNNLTDRLKADMASDSWLSKNIRPMTLIAILSGYFTFAMMSAFGMDTNKTYVELLGQWGMLIMSFYFGGRTLEKIMDMRSKQ